MAGPRMAMKLVERATPERRFDPGKGSGSVDGPALARRRRAHRVAYQERNRSLVDRDWFATAVCAGVILLMLAMIGLWVALWLRRVWS